MLDEHEKWTAFWNDKLKAKDTWYLPDYQVSADKPLVPDVEKHVVANFSTEKVCQEKLNFLLCLPISFYPVV